MGIRIRVPGLHPCPHFQYLRSASPQCNLLLSGRRRSGGWRPPKGEGQAAHPCLGGADRTPRKKSCPGARKCLAPERAAEPQYRMERLEKKLRKAKKRERACTRPGRWLKLSASPVVIMSWCQESDPSCPPQSFSAVLICRSPSNFS